MKINKKNIENTMFIFMILVGITMFVIMAHTLLKKCYGTEFQTLENEAMVVTAIVLSENSMCQYTIGQLTLKDDEKTLDNKIQLRAVCGLYNVNDKLLFNKGRMP